MPHRVIVKAVRDRYLGMEDVVSLIMLVVVLTAIGLGSFGIYKNFRSAQETKAALCIFKYDLIARRDAGLTFLKNNPGPEPIPGIKREVFETSIRSQTATIASLRALSCPQDHEQGG